MASGISESTSELQAEEGNMPQEAQRRALEVLLQSSKVLLDLASMDTVDYQASLNKNQNLRLGVCSLQKKVEDLQCQWPLEESFPAVQLFTRISFFHSTINNLQKDAEEQVALYHSLNGQLQDCERRNSKLERALVKLNSKNKKLVAKLQQRSHERRSLVKHVQDYVQQVKESKKEHQQLTEQNEAYRLRAHEHFLQQQDATPMRRRCFSNDDLPPRPSPPRSRCMSTDSNFSDLDALDFPTNNAMINDGESAVSGHFEDDAVEDSELSCFSDDYSTSASSLVTSDGVATLQLAASGSSLPETPPRSRAMSGDSNFGRGFLGWSTSSSKAKEEGAEVPPVLTISFPSTSEIGLQFEKRYVKEVQALAPSSNPTFMKRTQAKGLLDSVMSGPKKDPTSDSDAANERDVDNQSQLHTAWNNMFSKSSKSFPTKDVATNGMFVVCGFEGFDEDRSERPRLGDRLVSINGEHVDGKWSLEDLDQHLKQAGSIHHNEDAGISCEEKKCSEHTQRVTLAFQGMGKKGAEREGGMQTCSRLGFLKRAQGQTAPSKASALELSLTSQQKANVDKLDAKGKVPKMPTSKPAAPKISQGLLIDTAESTAYTQDSTKATKDDLPMPSHASGLMQFLSPQSYYNRPSPARKKAETTEQTQNDLGSVGTKVVEARPPSTEQKNAVTKLLPKSDSPNQKAEEMIETKESIPSQSVGASSHCDSPSSASNLMKFLSPQSYYHASASTTKRAEKVDPRQEGADAVETQTIKPDQDPPLWDNNDEVSGASPKQHLHSQKEESVSLAPREAKTTGAREAKTTGEEEHGGAAMSVNAKPSSTSKLMQFLSPQTFYQKHSAEKATAGKKGTAGLTR